MHVLWFPVNNLNIDNDNECLTFNSFTLYVNENSHRSVRMREED